MISKLNINFFNFWLLIVRNEGKKLKTLGTDEFFLVEFRFFWSKNKLYLFDLNSLFISVKKIKKLESYEINVGASAGMACFPSDTSDKINLMELADSALYKAKEGGKGQVFFHI